MLYQDKEKEKDKGERRRWFGLPFLSVFSIFNGRMLAAAAFVDFTELLKITR